MPFPQVLSLAIREERSVPAPPLPLVRKLQSSMRSELSLFSRLNTPSDLSCSSYSFPSRAFNILVALLWTLSNSLIFFFRLWHPKLPTIFKVRPPQCKAEWANALPCPAGDAVPDAPSRGLALLAAGHYWLMFNFPSTRTPRSLSAAAVQPLIPQSIHTTRIAPFQVQNLALALVKLHTLGDCPSL